MQQYTGNYQEALDIWRSEFKNFIAKVDAISEEWSSVLFTEQMLTDREKAVTEEYQPDMSWVDTCYDFRREVQAKIEEML